MIVQYLHDLFPKMREQKIFKILLTIKGRYIKYGRIGLSRLECTNFGISERQLKNFIDYLKNVGAIVLIDKVKASNGFLCNVYKVHKWFVLELNSIKLSIKQTFSYINPLEFIQSNFSYKEKYGKILFEHNGIKYVLNKRGKFKNVILDTFNLRIINPLELGK